MLLNKEQELAANHVSGPCLCTAVPGSGKTRVIVERTARMIQSGIDPKSILCITFTNKAATEMKERVAKRVGEEIGKKIFISTFHRLCSTILRYHGKWIGYDANMSIIDEDDQVSLMLQTARQLDQELTRPQIKKIVWATNDVRENLGNDDDLYEKFVDMKEEEWYKVAAEYLKRINAANMIDFSGMLSETHRLLKDFSQVLQAAQKRWSYFMLDEVQDTNLAQFKIVDLLCNHTKNIFVVGDLDQCQPEGTKVLTTSHGEVPIEDLDENKHSLVSFSTQLSSVVGRKYGLSFKKASRIKDDWFRTISLGDKATVCTSNHKWTVRLKRDKLREYHAVCLQKKGHMWRVGKTALYRPNRKNRSGKFGPTLQAQKEQVHATWVLKICKTIGEARAYEQLISLRYGISTVCFTEVKNLKIDDCFNNHKLLFECPLWTQGDSQDFIKQATLSVSASNLIPEIMQIPVPADGRNFEWSDFSIKSNLEQKKVYSLEVDKYAHYVADGIITHNSIYGWRGARSENVTDFQKKYGGKVISLGKNYRSTPQIIAVADKLIRHNSDRIDVDFSTDNADGIPVLCKSFATDLQEADAVAKTAKQIIESKKYTAKDIAVFYRMNSMSRAIEMAMIANNVPHTVIGSFSFFDRKEIKDCLALLRFFTNPKDGIAFHRIANKPKRGLGDTTVGKIELYAKENNCTIIEAMNNMHFPSKAVNEGMHEILDAYNFDSSNLSIPEILTHLLKKIRYEEHLKEDDGDSFAERLENLQELTRDTARHSVEHGPDVAKYLDQIALSTNSDKSADGDSVSLMSGHASKGLEFKVVFILGAEQGILPHKKAVEEREDGLQEERRLFFVMCTRAMQILSVSYCQRRQEGFAATKGQVRYKNSLPSQFLIETKLLKVQTKADPQSCDFSHPRKSLPNSSYNYLA